MAENIIEDRTVASTPGGISTHGMSRDGTGSQTLMGQLMVGPRKCSRRGDPVHEVEQIKLNST